MNPDFSPSNFTGNQWEVENALAVQALRPKFFLCPSDGGRLSSTGQLPFSPLSYRANRGRLAVKGVNNDGFFPLEKKVLFVWRKDGSKLGTAAHDVLDGLSNTAIMSERVLGDQNGALYSMKGDMIVSSLLTAAGTTYANAQTIRQECMSSTLTTDGDSLGGETWFSGVYRISTYNHVAPPNGKTIKMGAGKNGEGCINASSQHPGGVIVLFGDGSTRFVQERVNAEVWAAVAGIKDGSALGL